MDIIVCIRRVTQEQEPRQSKINPPDRNALEEALKLKERFSGKVIVLTMDAPVANGALEEALAVGADEGILICDNSCSGADTLATAYTLTCGVRSIGHFDLILCGNESTAGATGQVGPQLAEFLELPHVTHARQMDVSDEKSALVERALEYGYMKVDIQLPAVIAVVRGINRPRLPTVTGIMEAAEKEVKVWRADDIGAESHNIGLEGSPTCTLGEIERRYERGREIFTGPPEESVKKAVTKLKELGVI